MGQFRKMYRLCVRYHSIIINVKFECKKCYSDYVGECFLL